MGRYSILFCLTFAAAVQLALAPPVGAEPPPAPVPEAPAAAENDAPVAPPQGPTVTLMADQPGAGVERLQDRWTTVCSAPCKLQLTPGAAYRVGGPGLRPSEPFRLPRSSGDVVLDARLGSRGHYWTGFGMFAGGVPLAAAGLFWLLLASSFSSGSGPGAGAYVAGFALLGAGSGLSIYGYSIWSANRSMVDVR